MQVPMRQQAGLLTIKIIIEVLCNVLLFSSDLVVVVVLAKK